MFHAARVSTSSKICVLRRFPYLLFRRETYPQTFPPSSCQYVSTIHEKNTACYRPLKNRHFVGVCTEKMMDRQYGENSARNIHSNCNQMGAYVEYSSNQSKKIIPYRPFHRAIDETLKITEQCWPFLYLNFNRVLQFSFNSPGF